MPEIRQDPLTGAWVIFSPERAHRPRKDADFDPSAPHAAFDAPCPFCPGNEAMTPRETLALRPAGSAPDSPGWRVRCFPNSYPAMLTLPPELEVMDSEYPREPAMGIHEVLVETTGHTRDWSDFGAAEMTDVLAVCRQRSREIRAAGQVRQLVIFKNGGLAAGGSQTHPHMQLLGTPFLSWRTRDQLDRSREWFERMGGCLLCDMLAREMAQGVRLVQDDPHFAAFIPFAARQSFETWLLPKAHGAHFADLPEKRLADLAASLTALMRRISGTLKSPPFNAAIHTAPLDGDDYGWFHWRLEIVPRLNNVGGYEWSAGGHLNSRMPEEAARRLREG